VERDAKMPSIPKQGVRRMAFEIIPDLLDGVEFWRITGKRFDLKARVSMSQSSNKWALMDAAIVPQQDDRAAQVLVQKQMQKCGHIGRTVISRLEPKVQSHAFADGRNTESRQSRYSVVLIVVSHNRRLSDRSPRSPTTGNEKKAAFIEENQMGPKSSRLFLYVATCGVSNGQWPLHLAGWHDARALDRTSLPDAETARGDSDDR
jgi:hypothetical protein